MAGSVAAKLDLGADHPVIIHRVSMEEPWRWLAAGWRDIGRCPGVSVGYGLIWVVLSLMLVGGLWLIDQGSWLLPLIAGFMLMGPLVAVGNYEISRRLQQGMEVSLPPVLLAWRSNPTQIALMGVLLMVFLLAWIRFATILFALFFGVHIPTVETTTIYTDLLLSGTGVSLVLTGTVIGAILAFVAFALSVVSIPRLLDQPNTSVLEAVITSLAVVQQNFKPMLLWGFLLSVVTFAGLAVGFVGLAVALPLLGHASWHAYRDLVSEGTREPK
ncbi:putative membrane protein [Natronocella acetinitrilica]|jgi:uncharacterized membrane protein|uniref:Membrane protein n=1 Tax=Natronocella acetinitrilica TaxID=414046 RepID=A0AAE3G8S5_9GAMM|nr:DUF2189 domain-containing protein [Natronocella acetinitrilica]MCP1677123.1 putative membrane protein [Natronocella acetinitrilica]